jgi:hypothetical protein
MASLNPSTRADVLGDDLRLELAYAIAGDFQRDQADLSQPDSDGLTQGNSEVLPAQLEPDGATMLVAAVAPSVGDQFD